MFINKITSLFKKNTDLFEIIENKEEKTFFNNKHVRMAMIKKNLIPNSYMRINIFGQQIFRPIDYLDTDIDKYLIKPIVVKNKITDTIKNTFTFKNKKNILYLISIGYTRTEAKNIIAAISKPSNSKEKVAELIADIPSKQQKIKKYSSQTEYKNHFTEAVEYLKNLGYTDEKLIRDSVFCTQELTSDKDSFLAYIKDTPTVSDRNKGYYSIKEKTTILNDAIDIITNRGYSDSQARKHVGTLYSNNDYRKFNNAINLIKDLHKEKERSIYALVKEKGYSKSEAKYIFKDLVLNSLWFDQFTTNLAFYPKKEFLPKDSFFPSGAMTERSNALLILGIKTKNPTQMEIKRAYRALARKYHPDKNPDKAARAQFNTILDAYNLLIN